MKDIIQLTRNRSIVNRKNLFAMVEYLATVPEKAFTMKYYNKTDITNQIARVVLGLFISNRLLATESFAMAYLRIGNVI